MFKTCMYTCRITRPGLNGISTCSSDVFSQSMIFSTSSFVIWNPSQLRIADSRSTRTVYGNLSGKRQPSTGSVRGHPFRCTQHCLYFMEATTEGLLLCTIPSSLLCVLPEAHKMQLCILQYQMDWLNYATGCDQRMISIWDVRLPICSSSRAARL